MQFCILNYDACSILFFGHCICCYLRKKQVIMDGGEPFNRHSELLAFFGGTIAVTEVIYQ